MHSSPPAAGRAALIWSALALGAVCAFSGTPAAAAASFRCSAHATINDAGPQADNSTTTPCSLLFGAPGDSAFAATSANLGILRGGTHAASAAGAASGGPFVGSSSYAQALDRAVVGGLGDEGATLHFLVNVDGFLNANGSAPTQFYATAATASFSAKALLFTDRDTSSRDEVTGCVRNVESGISTCNGTFDYGVSLSETVQSVMPLSIFVKNGDTLFFSLELQTSSLAWAPDRGQAAEASAHFGNTMYWDGLVSDDASRSLTLTADSGFDYRFSALPHMGGVPEPASWALMITGLGLAGATLRRRRIPAAT